MIQLELDSGIVRKLQSVITTSAKDIRISGKISEFEFLNLNLDQSCGQYELIIC